MDTAAGRDFAARSEQVFRLVYRSHDRIPPEHRRIEHATLFTASRASNKHNGITGALLLSGDSFAQTLEGDEASVLALFARIERDTRHDSIELLQARTPVERVFPRWSMARVSADAAAPDTLLIAHVDGIAATMHRVSSPEQETVLRVMRASTARSAGAEVST